MSGAYDAEARLTTLLAGSPETLRVLWRVGPSAKPLGTRGADEPMRVDELITAVAMVLEAYDGAQRGSSDHVTRARMAVRSVCMLMACHGFPVTGQIDDSVPLTPDQRAQARLWEVGASMGPIGGEK